MASPAKKTRHDGKAKSFFAKQARKSFKNAIEPGDRGFLVTCNYKERDAKTECYQILNDYYKKLNPEKEETKNDDNNDEDDDIAAQLQSSIENTKKESKERVRTFNAKDTGVSNLFFISTAIDDPLLLGTTIIRDLAETKKKRTKVTLRFIPIEAVCKAKIEDIKNAAGLLFDKHFLKEPSTFGILFNKRYNQDIQRVDVIRELADLVTAKNIANKVNLKDPQQSIIVEIIKNTCMLTVLPDYFKLKKYNLNELWGRSEGEEISSKEVKDSETEAGSKPDPETESKVEPETKDT